LSLLGELLDLLRRGRCCQHLVGRIQVLVKLVHFGLQSHQFLAGILVLSQGGDRLDDLVGIHLRGQVHMYDDRIAVETGTDLLAKHQDYASRVRSYLVFGDIQVRYHCNAFQIRGHLLEGVALGCFCCQADRILPGVPVSHPVFALCGYNPHVRMSGVKKEECQEQTSQEQGDY